MEVFDLQKFKQDCVKLVLILVYLTVEVQLCPLWISPHFHLSCYITRPTNIIEISLRNMPHSSQVAPKPKCIQYEIPRTGYQCQCHRPSGGERGACWGSWLCFWKHHALLLVLPKLILCLYYLNKLILVYTLLVLPKPVLFVPRIIFSFGPFFAFKECSYLSKNRFALLAWMRDQLNDWISKNCRHCDGGSGGQVRCMRTGFEIFMQDIFIQPAGQTFATKQRQISLDIKYRITLH